MSHETPSDPLREALRSLPRARPEAGFTERVLDRVEARRSGRPWMIPPTARWAAAAVLAAAVVAGALSLPLSPLKPAGERETDPRRPARVEALEAERFRLAAELEEIRRLATSLREPAPMLYLGGDEEVDLVLDLDRLMQDRPTGTGATPTAYRGPRRP